MREWVTELTKVLFSDVTGLFKQAKVNEDLSYFPNSKAKHSYEGEVYKEYCRFAGQVVAKALFDKIPIMIKLNKTIVKRIVGNKQAVENINVEDLKEYD